MSGAVTELVAQGVQDTYLTGDPQMSFFRQVYKRHTNFALESVRQIFKGQPAINGMSSVTLKRAGDLVNGLYLCEDITDGDTIDGANGSIAAQIDRVELYIGGQKIDEYSGNASAVFATSALIPKSYTGLIPQTYPKQFLPLYFFCCNDSNSPLPLVALQYHDVDVRIYWSAETITPSLALYANYAYLDTPERNVFAQNKQELLITQHQEITWTAGETIIDLPFSHPVKVLFIADKKMVDKDTLITSSPALTDRMTLDLNGQQRFEPQNSIFFRYTQPYYYGSGSGYHDNSTKEKSPLVYSFALDYGQTQPSGTLNFSRIDNARWHVSSVALGVAQVIRCMAINYNVLKCENGMGGLLFAN